MFLRFMFRGCGVQCIRWLLFLSFAVVCKKWTQTWVRWIVGAAYPLTEPYLTTLHSCYMSTTVAKHRLGVWYPRALLNVYKEECYDTHAGTGMESVKCYLSVYDTQGQRVRKFRIIASEIGERRALRWALYMFSFVACAM